MLGLILVFVPNLLLTLFTLPTTTEVWIRVVGVLALVLALYYIQAARHVLRDFFQWTVYARLGVFLFFTAFVLLGLVKPVFVLFGVVDLLAAIWTQATLHSSKKG